MLRRRTVLKAGAVTGVLGSTAAAAPAAQATETPAEMMRLPDMPLHDPYIVADKATRTYYLFTSNRSDVSGVDGTGTMVYRSRDLLDWLEPEVVFLTREGMWATDGGWAPEVHEYRGKYYLFTTLHNEAKPLPLPPPNQYNLPVRTPQYMRGTIVAVADSLLGPFTPLDETRPTPPPEFMTLDGTLYVDRDRQPWMVYAHEWLQKIDGTMEAIRLTPDLKGTVGDPIHLFKGSDAFWISEEIPAPSTHQIVPYVTDGPQLYRTKRGALIMLWSTWAKTGYNSDGTLGGLYNQTYAISRSGKLQGPWEQQRPLVRDNSGHGMLFRTFEGQLMLVLHRPFGHNARGKLYEVELAGNRVRVLRQRTDLDGGG